MTKEELDIIAWKVNLFRINKMGRAQLEEELQDLLDVGVVVKFLGEDVVIETALFSAYFNRYKTRIEY